jgi:hypothetical protein
MASKHPWVAIVACVLLAGCGRQAAKGQSREAVTALLQQEAADLKKGGEDLDPAIGVRVTWIVEGIDVVERPGDKETPWTGAIRFRIRSENKEPDGTLTTDSFEKRFEYRYSAVIKRWIIDVKPGAKP